MKQQRGFALVELIVAIGIIAVLAALLFPILGQAKNRSFLTRDISQMRQIYVALDLYDNDYDDQLPDSLLYVAPYAKSTEVFASPIDPFRDGIPGIRDFPANMDDDDGTHLRSPFRISYAYLVPMARSIGLDKEWIEARRRDPGYGLLALSMYNQTAGLDKLPCQVDYFRNQNVEHRISMDGSYHEAHVVGPASWSCGVDYCFGKTDYGATNKGTWEMCPTY